jgi:hypothetical protein
MMPTVVNEQALVPPSAYHRAQARHAENDLAARHEKNCVRFWNCVKQHLSPGC